MSIIKLCTPQGTVAVDSETITDKELEALGVTRKALFEELAFERLTLEGEVNYDSRR